MSLVVFNIDHLLFIYAEVNRIHWYNQIILRQIYMYEGIWFDSTR